MGIFLENVKLEDIPSGHTLTLNPGHLSLAEGLHKVFLKDFCTLKNEAHFPSKC